jgi:hypothetical protein
MASITEGFDRRDLDPITDVTTTTGPAAKAV